MIQRYTVDIQNSKCRNTNIEILRFILMCFIFFWHILVHGYNLKQLGGDGVTVQHGFFLYGFLLTLFVPSTYCFVFISGYYGITFKLKKLLSLLLGCFIVSISAWFYDVICYGRPFEIIHFMESLLPISTNKWWFMTCFVLLYIISPILNEGFDKLLPKQQRTILFILFIFSSVGILALLPNCGSNFMGILMIYLMGRYAKRQSGGACIKKPIIIFFISFISLFVGIIGIYYISVHTEHKSLAKLIFPLLGYSNPLVIIMSISLFYTVKNLPEFNNVIINKILSANLFIYLLTEAGSFISYHNIANVFDYNPSLGLCYSICIVLSCLLAGHIITEITNLTIRNV